MQERIWYLKSSTFLEMFDADQLAAIDRQSRWKKFSRGTPIYLPGAHADSVYIVAEGLVKLCHLTADGKVSTLAFIKIGEVFGELSLLESGSRGEYCEAAADTAIIRIPRETLLPYMEVNMRFVVAITKIVGFRRRRIENRLKTLLFSSNQQRLAHLLLDLAEQFGLAVDDSIRIGLKLSHQELANLIGTTRETVTIMLGKMKADGVIGGKRESVVLTDIWRLASSVDRQWHGLDSTSLYAGEGGARTDCVAIAPACISRSFMRHFSQVAKCCSTNCRLSRSKSPATYPANRPATSRHSRSIELGEKQNEATTKNKAPATVLAPNRSKLVCRLLDRTRSTVEERVYFEQGFQPESSFGNIYMVSLFNGLVVI